MKVLVVEDEIKLQETIVEFLEKEFHHKWHSSEYEETLKKIII